MARQPQVPMRGRRFVPVPTGGSGRECGGTGVFLPRVSGNEVMAPTKKKPSKFNAFTSFPVFFLLALFLLYVIFNSCF